MLKMSKAFVVRMVVWSALVLYLIADFYIFTGPLKRELRSMFPTQQDENAHAVAEGVCATVYNAPIYRGQVDRRVREQLWRTGRNPEKVSASEMQSLRWVALNEMIDEHIMRIKVRVNVEAAPVSEDEVDAEVRRFERRFESAEDLDRAMAAQGIESRKELRFRLAARLQQEKYVLAKIQPHIEVGEQEARQWYDDHRKELTMPERRRVRHIFLATLDRPSDEAKATLAGHLALLKSGRTSFAKLAAELSEDARSKDEGGDLGWMGRQRIPGDFAASVFSMPERSPALVRTKLGWHIIEVTGVKPPGLLPYEAMEGEIAAAISDSRREAAIKQYRHQLRLLNYDKVKIFKTVLE